MPVRRLLAALMIVIANVGIVQLETVGRASAAVMLHTHWIETFDGVTAPAFPAGWTAECVSCQAGDAPWVTANFGGSVADNRPIARPKTHVTDNRLTSAPFTYRTGAQLQFRHGWKFAATGVHPDGGVVEIQIGGGPWTDIITAGGSCNGATLPGCYNGSIKSQTNPLNNRNAYVGDSGLGFIYTTITLPASGVGQTVSVRWRLGSDANGAGDDGTTFWSIDNVGLVSEFLTVTVEQAAGQPDPAVTSPVNFTATFNDTVSSLTGADISFAGSTAPGTLSAAVTGGPTTFNVAVSGMTGPGQVVASVPQRGRVAVPSADANYASTSVDNTVQFTPDTTAPACTVTSIGVDPVTGQKFVQASAQDTGSGIASVSVPTAVNVVLPVTMAPSPIPQGTTSPVVLTAYKADQTMSAQVAFVVTDVAGNQGSCT